jgi:hypothetical protein
MSPPTQGAFNHVDEIALVADAAGRYHPGIISTNPSLSYA